MDAAVRLLCEEADLLREQNAEKDDVIKALRAALMQREEPRSSSDPPPAPPAVSPPRRRLASSTFRRRVIAVALGVASLFLLSALRTTASTDAHAHGASLPPIEAPAVAHGNASWLHDIQERAGALREALQQEAQCATALARNASDLCRDMLAFVADVASGG